MDILKHSIFCMKNTNEECFCMLLEDVLKEFIYDAELRGLSPRTIKGYRNNNLRFIKFLDEELNVSELEKVTTKQIKMYLSLLKQQKLKETYANGILKTVRSFFNYCVGEEYIAENPAHKVKWIKEPKVLINTFTDEEIVRMLKVLPNKNYLNTRNNAILAMFLETGIRNLELCNIKKEHIRDRDIVIQGKGNKERVVPLTPALNKYLIKYDRVREVYFYDKLLVDDYYFLSRTGRQLTIGANENIIANIGKLAGVREEIRCSPHTLRHYFAQSQIKNKLDVYSLSRLLGHEDISITRRYLQSLEDKELIDIASNTSVLSNLKRGAI